MDPLLSLVEQEELRGLIVESFPGPNGVANLDIALKATLGYSLFDDVVGAGIPIGPAAESLIQRTEGEGTTTLMVKALFLLRKQDGALREWVSRRRPDLLALVPKEEFESAVLTSVNDGVQGLREIAAARPDVRSILNDAHLDLRKLPGEIAKLALYKGLHDVLHNVQVPLYRSILDALKSFPADDACADALAEYAGQLKQRTADARDVLSSAPPLEPGDRATEESWIAQLDQLASALAVATAANDKRGAFMQAMALKGILRAQPPRLDAELVAAARNIPFRELIGAMTAIGAMLRDGSSHRVALSEAATSLHQIENDVTAQVAEHASWQAIEVNLWMSEDAIRNDDEDSVMQFSAHWAAVEEQIGKVCAVSPGDWALELENWSASFHTLCPEPVSPPIADGARRAFQRYVSAGRLRFYLLDKELKQRCDKVTTLSEPLSNLIAGVHP